MCSGTKMVKKITKIKTIFYTSFTIDDRKLQTNSLKTGRGRL